LYSRIAKPSSVKVVDGNRLNHGGGRALGAAGKERQGSV